jgi:hypothetical protein
MTSKLPLPHLHYRFAATSTHNLAISGSVRLLAYATREDVEELCLNKVAHTAVEQGIAWNPFNVTLAFTPIE